MDETISRQAVLALPRDRIRNMRGEIVEETINVADVEALPSAQRKGKWLEKKVIPVYENGFPLQSCKCSECDRYDTRPYMYYFSEPNFCSYCGADMRQDDPSHPFTDDVMMKGEEDAKSM